MTDKPVFWKDPVFYFFIVVLALAALLYTYAKTILILLFVTLLLFILLRPLVQRLSKLISKGWSVTCVLTSVVGLAVLVIGFILHTIIPELAQFAKDFPSFILQFDVALLKGYIPDEFMSYARQMLHDAAAFAVNIVRDSVGPLIKAFSGLAEMIAVPFLTFYLLKDGESIVGGIKSYCPSGLLERMEPFFQEANAVLGGYIRGQMIIAGISGTVVFSAMSIMGIPYAPILALVAALCEFVPVIGSVVATVPAVLIALAYSPLLALKVLLFYVILLKVNHNLVYPKVVGKAIKVHPMFIMIAVLLFGHLFGVIGMLFAVPVVALTRVWLISLLKK